MPRSVSERRADAERVDFRRIHPNLRFGTASDRYAGWETPEAKEMLGSDLGSIAQRVLDEGINPQPRSGRQEILENYINRFV